MTRIPRTLGAFLIGAAMTLATTLPATALPPGGAGSDTPGTSASVSPRSLTAGSVLRFTIAGFPAGETVYIKIDDGSSCSKDAAQGACVYHSQKLNSSGTASGSFVLPSDIKPGAHALRFLASKELLDDKGTYQGVEGYTRRTGSEFTIVAASKSSKSSTGSSGSSTQSDGSAGTTDPAEAVGSARTSATTQGEIVKIEPQKVEPTVEPVQESTPDVAVAGAANDTSEAPIVPAGESTDFPLIGVVGFLLLLLASVGVVWGGLRRPPGRSAGA